MQGLNRLQLVQVTRLQIRRGLTARQAYLVGRDQADGRVGTFSSSVGGIMKPGRDVQKGHGGPRAGALLQGHGTSEGFIVRRRRVGTALLGCD